MRRPGNGFARLVRCQEEERQCGDYVIFPYIDMCLITLVGTKKNQPPVLHSNLNTPLHWIPDLLNNLQTTPNLVFLRLQFF